MYYFFLRPWPKHSDPHNHGQDTDEMLPNPHDFGAHSADEDFHIGAQPHEFLVFDVWYLYSIRGCLLSSVNGDNSVYILS